MKMQKKQRKRDIFSSSNTQHIKYHAVCMLFHAISNQLSAAQHFPCSKEQEREGERERNLKQTKFLIIACRISPIFVQCKKPIDGKKK